MYWRGSIKETNGTLLNKCLKMSRKLGGEDIFLVSIQQEPNETQGLWVKTERLFFTKLVVKLWNTKRWCRFQKFPIVKKPNNEAGYISGKNSFTYSIEIDCVWFSMSLHLPLALLEAGKVLQERASWLSSDYPVFPCFPRQLLWDIAVTGCWAGYTLFSLMLFCVRDNSLPSCI